MDTVPDVQGDEDSSNPVPGDVVRPMQRLKKQRLVIVIIVAYSDATTYFVYNCV